MSFQSFHFLCKLKNSVKNSSVSFVVDREEKAIYPVDIFRNYYPFKEKSIQVDFPYLDMYLDVLLSQNYIKLVDSEKQIYRLKDKGAHPFWYLFWKYVVPAIFGGISGWIVSHI